MSRLAAMDCEQTSGRTRQLLDQMCLDMGMVPNLYRTMAHSPAGLQAFDSLRSGLLEGVVSERLQLLIGLTVAECDHAEYSRRAHAALAKTIGVSDQEIRDACRGCSPDRKCDALLHFARDVAEHRGSIQDADYQRLLSAGCTGQEIVETLCWIGLFTLADYVSEAVQVECDFPPLAERSLAETAVHDPGPHEGKAHGAHLAASGSVESLSNVETRVISHHDPLRETKLIVHHDRLR